MMRLIVIHDERKRYRNVAVNPSTSALAFHNELKKKKASNSDSFSMQKYYARILGSFLKDPHQ